MPGARVESSVAGTAWDARPAAQHLSHGHGQALLEPGQGTNVRPRLQWACMPSADCLTQTALKFEVFVCAQCVWVPAGAHSQQQMPSAQVKHSSCTAVWPAMLVHTLMLLL